MALSAPGPIANVVGIAVGAGVFSSTPYRAKDIDPLSGPELLYLRQGGIEVIQA